MIRVVIKTNGFQEIAHAEIKFQAEGGLIATAGDEKREYGQGEVFAVTPDDAMFQKGTIKVESVVPEDKITVSSLNRGYGTPSYRGSFELFSSAEGMNSCKMNFLWRNICMRSFQVRCRRLTSWKRSKHRRSVREVMLIIRHKDCLIRNIMHM